VSGQDGTPAPVRIPADVEAADAVAFGLTTRQLCIAATVAAVLWIAYTTTRALLPTPVFLALALPVIGTTAAVLMIRRDGLGLDELLVAALRQSRAPRRLATTAPGDPPGAPVPRWVAAEPGPMPAPLRLPARAISGDGVLDVAQQGAAVLAWCQGVNFALRSPAEQDGLLAGFAAWLHSLTGPAQIVIRSTRLDLTPLVTQLAQAASGMPHPALSAAAADHAGFLADLGARHDLLRRHILLVLREPHRGLASNRGARAAAGSAAAAAVAVRRGLDAVRALAAAEVKVVPLDAAAVTATVRAAVDPFGPPPPAQPPAAAGDVITGVRS
jgi:hypothetical protein